VRINATAPLAPASTEKLLTAAGALKVLGADHRFRTVASATAAVQDGTLAGDLFVVGGGDPVLTSPASEAALATHPNRATLPVTRLADLADAIVAAGVRRIDGSLVADDHRHEALRFLPVWKPSYRTDGDVGALSALTVDGGFTDPARTRLADDPALLTVQRLAELLQARNVSIGGGTTHGLAPAGAHELAHVDSAPLADVVREMLTVSDNYTAELLTRELGVEGDQAGSTELGTRVIVHELPALGISADAVDLHDGSGLAPSDRVTCDALLGALTLASRPGFEAIDTGLAVAGRSGTLASRFVGDPLAGRLRAKTGQIAGVVGLAGVVDDDEHLHFAFLANGNFGEAAGQALQARIARAVASYPDAPDPNVLVPAP
jgi:D-alanyl-D-alanine carboxypeptidase/D-alanyl-D-alanine-endopeptidase (penicillin-binding protein 4)